MAAARDDQTCVSCRAMAKMDLAALQSALFVTRSYPPCQEREREREGERERERERDDLRLGRVKASQDEKMKVGCRGEPRKLNRETRETHPISHHGSETLPLTLSTDGFFLGRGRARVTLGNHESTDFRFDHIRLHSRLIFFSESSQIVNASGSTRTGSGKKFTNNRET